MAARLAPDHVQRMHECLHHFIAKSPWSDADLLRQVRTYVLPAMQRIGPVTAWVVDETGFVKKGSHSVGVARQYCGRVGKKENCQVAVSLSIASATASLPIAWRLYLPKEWANDPERCREADIPQEVQFQTKPQIALRQIRQAVEDGVAPGVVLADEVYGSNREFRDGVAELKLDYSLAVRSNTTVWALERQPLPPKPWRGKGAKPTRMRRDQTHRPITVKELAAELPEKAWREVAWREGSKETLRSRFAALRVRPAYGDDRRGGLQPEQWLLIEWPSGAVEPAGYWLARLPVKISMKCLVGIRKHRWVIERDYEELKSDSARHTMKTGTGGISPPRHTLHCGLRLFDGGTEPFFPLGPHSRILGYDIPRYLPTSGPRAHRARAQRHNPRSIATLRIQIARFLVQQLPCCPICCRLRVEFMTQ